MYSDERRRFPDMDVSNRRIIRKEESIGRWRLARIAGRERRLGECVSRLWFSPRADLRGSIERAMRRATSSPVNRLLRSARRDPDGLMRCL